MKAVKPLASAPHGWILIHSRERYQDRKYDNPRDELVESLKEGKKFKWHWKLPHPMNDDIRPRRVLIGWEKCVVADAVATVTTKIGNADHSLFNFAFVLSDVRVLPSPISFSALPLGNRATYHRSLIKLNDEILNAYDLAVGGRHSLKPKEKPTSDLIQNDAAAEGMINPHKGQGSGLTPQERRVVESHAMKLARLFLKRRFDVLKDHSASNPYDYLAQKQKTTRYVEVKGTTGAGESIFLTAGEVEWQKANHPNGMLIVVHSIKLGGTSKEPKATGGKLRMIDKWRIDRADLKPRSYSYEV
jgi:hypothetical protein